LPIALIIWISNIKKLSFKSGLQAGGLILKLSKEAVMIAGKPVIL